MLKKHAIEMHTNFHTYTPIFPVGEPPALLGQGVLIWGHATVSYLPISHCPIVVMSDGCPKAMTLQLIHGWVLQSFGS